jgi:nicotinamide phosphoribosyltransferase
MDTMKDILTVLRLRMYSSENISFGSGGYISQCMDRDTLGFAIKCSEITYEFPHYGWNLEYLGVKTFTREVYKDPITDSGKKSKKGKVTTYFNTTTNEFEVDLVNRSSENRIEVLKTVIKNGVLVKECSLSDVRNNVQLCLDNKISDILGA